MTTETLRPPLCDWDSPENPTFHTWTTVNVGEVIPGVAHPLVATMYQEWHRDLFRDAFRAYGVADLIPVYAAPIPNFLAFWAGQGALSVGFTAAMVSSYQTGEGSSAVEQLFTADDAGDHRAGPAADRWRAHRTRSRMFRIWGQMPKAARADRARAVALAERVAGTDLDRLSEKALWKRFDRVGRLLQTTFIHHIQTTLGGAEYASMLGQVLQSQIADLEPEAVLQLTSALGEVESARPAQALWGLSRWVRTRPALCAEVAAGRPSDLAARLDAPPTADWRDLAERFAAFLRAYGFRGQNEWMLSLPDWSEAREFPLNSLRSMVGAEDAQSPPVLAERAATARREAETAYRARMPRRRRSTYDACLARAQRYVRLREYTKATSVMGLRPGRPILRALGRSLTRRGLLSEPDEIFFLFYGEVEEALHGGLTRGEAQAAVARRREQFASLDGYVLPDNFTGLPTITRRSETPAAAALLTGLGVSPGVATGPARVVASLEAARAVTVHPGEVLVAPFTDAPWTPLFLTAAAVVVETGGLLSHAATVAREFGIPAVVMVKDATRRIQTGQSIRVDGRSGEVRIGTPAGSAS